MATVVIQKRKRKDHCSYPVYYKDPATGRRKYFKTFQRQKDAQKAANDLRALLDTGEMSEIKKSKARLDMLTLEEVGESLKRDWENRQKRSELSHKTLEGYCCWVNYAEKAFGKKLLCEISIFVFCRLDGTPIKSFDKAWREARRIAGFDGLHFHDLRHTFCSNLLLSGVDLKDVKEMIGHRDLSMTDRYAHLNIGRKLLNQEKLAKFYSSNNRVLKPSGEHRGNTEGKIGYFHKNGQAG